jgi:LPS export ABC transporter protein LptC
MKLVFGLCAAAIFSAAFFACSFDYGDNQDSDKNRPDIVMENLEYVRVRGGDPIARFKAEYAERWEDRQTMELRDFTFEQLEDGGETVNAAGRAGAARVQLESGDISLKNGVRINIESEDYNIRTAGLEWKDKEKTLTGGENAEVDIERSDGTSFTGKGFSADIRGRTWDFTGEVAGSYVETEDDDEDAGETSASDEAVGETPATRPIPAAPPSSPEDK